MNIELIQKRIKIAQEVSKEPLKEFAITKKEAKELGNITEIDGVKLIVATELSKVDCFGYINNNGHESCYGLKKLGCTNCNFYKNDITKEDIEKDIRKYGKC